MHVLSIIPARIGSARVREKPLCTIGGEPLVLLVARKVIGFGLDGPVVVATDDERVAAAVAPLGVTAVLTRPTHRSGTERCAEVLDVPEFAWADVVLNVQGDELFLPREAAVGALARLVEGYAIGTAAAPLDDSDWSDPDRVKIGVNALGCARWFSRSEPARAPSGEPVEVYRHLGVYAYSRQTVRRWVALPEAKEEREHSLEQLRPLAHGLPIGVAVVERPVEPGIDTPGDLRRVRTFLEPTRITA